MLNRECIIAERDTLHWEQCVLSSGIVTGVCVSYICNWTMITRRQCVGNVLQLTFMVFTRHVNKIFRPNVDANMYYILFFILFVNCAVAFFVYTDVVEV